MNGAVERPRLCFRTIRGQRARYNVEHYSNQHDRDETARLYANSDGEPVICELWSPSHPQDDANRGWACDKTVEPERSRS